MGCKSGPFGGHSNSRTPRCSSRRLTFDFESAEGACILLYVVAPLSEGPIPGVEGEFVVDHLAGCGRVKKARKPNEGPKAVPRYGPPHIHGTRTAAGDLGHMLDLR